MNNKVDLHDLIEEGPMASNTPLNDIIMKIKESFSDLKSKLEDNTLPNFYRISTRFVSPNPIMETRFMKPHFSYYFSNYLQKQYKALIARLKYKSKIAIKGFEASGKSYFLSDFVLRQRLLASTSNFCIFYIHCSKNFLHDPIKYLLNEILYMITIYMKDDENVEDLTLDEISEFPDTIESLQSLLECYNCLKGSTFPDSQLYYQFFKLLKRYYNDKDKRFILIIDQINDLYGFIKPQTISFYEAIDNCECFDCVGVCEAYNNNANYSKRNRKNDISLEISPFEIFSSKRKELLKVIYEETGDFKPLDIDKRSFHDYSEKLFNLLKGSVVEYSYYKEFNVKTIGDMTFREAIDNYNFQRNNKVMISEASFIREIVKAPINVLANWQNIPSDSPFMCYTADKRFLLTYERYLSMEDDEQKVFFD